MRRRAEKKEESSYIILPYKTSLGLIYVLDPGGCASIQSRLSISAVRHIHQCAAVVTEWIVEEKKI